MHRFGRSAQKKMNDRWGGVFMLAVVLAVFAAWQVGGWLGKVLSGDEKQAAMEPTPGMTNMAGTPSKTPQTVMQPQEFQIHFVQAGAFRSEAKAKSLAADLAQNGYAAALSPKGADGLVKVYTGPYLTLAAAEDAKGALAAQEATRGSFRVTMTVDYKPEAVMAMSGTANSELQKGLDVLNSYLNEAGTWFANRAVGDKADGAVIAAMASETGQYLNQMAKADANPAVAKFMAMAKAAGENAAAIGMAANAQPGSAEFQAALNGYVSLLDQYHAFHAQKGN